MHATRLMSAPTRGAVTAIAAAALAVAANANGAVMATVVAALVLVFAWGFPHLMGASAPRVASVVIALTGLAAVAVQVWRPDDEWLAVVLAFGVGAAFLAQMFRRDGRPRLVESVSASVAGLVVAVSAVGWIEVVDQPGGLSIALVAAAALALAAATTFLPGPGGFAAAAALLVPTLLAAALGEALTDVQTLSATLAGFAAGAMVATTHILFLKVRVPPRPLAAVAAALLTPLALGIPVAQLATFLG